MFILEFSFKCLICRITQNTNAVQLIKKKIIISEIAFAYFLFLLVTVQLNIQGGKLPHLELSRYFPSFYFAILSFFLHFFSRYVWTLVLPSVPRQLPALAELTALYVGRTWTLWKEAAVMLWLEESVKAVLRRVDTMDPMVEDCQSK